MARENFVVLHGQVRKSPKVFINNDGEVTKAIISVLILRRPIKAQGFDNKLYFDCPVILSRNPDIIKVIKGLQKNDMIDIRGVFSTKEVIKTSTCPICGGKNEVPGTLTYITPLFIKKNDVAKDDAHALELLKERSEISNIINVIGYVCQEPEFYVDANNKSYAQYPLAVNRRYHIKEDPESKKTDYPWIKTFGLQACDDSKCLHIGSSVYINGALQSRSIERHSICPDCGEDYTWNDSVTEIVPYYIGYLANCDVPDKDKDTDSISEE